MHSWHENNKYSIQVMTIENELAEKKKDTVKKENHFIITMRRVYEWYTGTYAILCTYRVQLITWRLREISLFWFASVSVNAVETNKG